jgi:hypothetical protein
VSTARTARIAASAALVAIAAAACDADVEEGCVGGACGGASAGSSTTSSGAGGAHDAGSLDAAPCDNSAATGDFPPAVARALVNCQRCHVPADQGPLQPAPFPLLRYEDVKAEYGHEPIWRRMAPALRSGFMPSAPPKLDAVDEQALLDWLDACAPPAPEGAGCDVGEGCQKP